MQNLPFHLRIGDRVIARRLPWRVVDVRVHDACALVTLAGAGSANVGLTRTLISPFDVVRPVTSRGVGVGDVAATYVVPRRVSPARWRRACRALIAAHRDAAALQSAIRAKLDLLPHQLEPALALTQGRGTRVLIADDVGLGKTVQAGLILSELIARGAADRALVLVPAGLRDQWAMELSTRFGLEATVADAGEAVRRAAELPVSLNPWATWPLAVASLDYVKRPEVFPAVFASRWDAVIVDEAHNVAPPSDRYDAVSRLCERAAYVVLLTATPHHGDPQAFAALTSLGSHDQPGDLLVFRRTRKGVALPTARRVHRHLVRATGPERALHAQLSRIAARVRGDEGALIMSLLWKRALSSAGSLGRTIDRRLHALAATAAPPAEDDAQLALPFDRSGEFDPGDEVPAWSVPLVADAHEETRILEALRRAASAAARKESKVAVLRTLVRRLLARGERVLVFTEYRDTLAGVREHLVSGALRSTEVAVLHGGLTRAERSTAVAQFTAGNARVLLATDAGAEGLNLHARCRTVVNVELPWNPMRLEQRIGRVDRFGQTRTVHAFHLIGADTPETNLLMRLHAKLADAEQSIPVPNPLESESSEHSEAIRPAQALEGDARGECVRLVRARLLYPERDDPGPEFDRPLATHARNRVTRARLAGRTLVIARSAVRDGFSRTVATRITGWLADAKSDRDAIGAVPGSAFDGWADEACRCAECFWKTRQRREESIAARVRNELPRPFQPGLYDSRIARAHDQGRQEQMSAASEADVRANRAQVAAAVQVTPLAPVLILEP